MLRRLAPLALSVLLLAASCGCGRKARPVLRLYCGAALRPAVTQLVTEFSRDHAVTVESDYGGSAVLLSRIKLAREGDLYMPGDVRYVRSAREAGLIASSVDACYAVPVILVAARAAGKVHALADLAAPGLRVGLGEPTACAIGEVSKEILDKAGLTARVQKNVVFTALTADELGLQIRAGRLEAVIVWDAVARQYPGAKIVEIGRSQNVISTLPVAVLKSSQHRDLARAFQEFATSDRGREIWARHGFTTTPPG
jgi:molybdate transport system substrate-binding protein